MRGCGRRRGQGIHRRAGGVRSRCCRLMLKVGIEVGRTARHTAQPARAKPHQNASGRAHSKRRSATPQIEEQPPNGGLNRRLLPMWSGQFPGCGVRHPHRVGVGLRPRIVRIENGLGVLHPMEGVGHGALPGVVRHRLTRKLDEIRPLKHLAQPQMSDADRPRMVAWRS